MVKIKHLGNRDMIGVTAYQLECIPRGHETLLKSAHVKAEPPRVPRLNPKVRDARESIKGSARITRK